MTSLFYSLTLLFHPFPVVSVISIFRNAKKYICSPRRECPLPTGLFQLFYPVRNKVYAKRGGRQFSMFMSEDICAMVNVFDNAVAGAGGRDNGCGNEVGR